MIPAPHLFTVVKGELFIGDTWPPVPKNGCIASCESWREIYPKDLCDALQACGWRVGRLAMKLTTNCHESWIIMIRSSNTLVLCVFFFVVENTNPNDRNEGRDQGHNGRTALVSMATCVTDVELFVIRCDELMIWFSFTKHDQINSLKSMKVLSCVLLLLFSFSEWFPPSKKTQLWLTQTLLPTVSFNRGARIGGN